MLSIVRQTDVSIKVNFTENGTPINITGYEVLFTVKEQDYIGKGDDKALITKDITSHTNPSQGETYIVLSNEETNIPAGNYYWDLRLIKDGVITQTKRDMLEITQGITERTS